jgi:hypothetical protein
MRYLTLFIVFGLTVSASCTEWEEDPFVINQRLGRGVNLTALEAPSEGGLGNDIGSQILFPRGRGWISFRPHSHSLVGTCAK